MALSTPYVPTGEFVPERKWTCKKHSQPWYHECDCQHCERKWDCETCATSEWRDVLNRDGTPKMRELSPFEVMLRKTNIYDFALPGSPLHLTPSNSSAAFVDLMTRQADALLPRGPIEWLEDTLIPRMGSNDG